MQIGLLRAAAMLDISGDPDGRSAHDMVELAACQYLVPDGQGILRLWSADTGQSDGRVGITAVPAVMVLIIFTVQLGSGRGDVG